MYPGSLQEDACIAELAIASRYRRTLGTLLQGESADDGGSEEAIGGEVYAGHAYPINQVGETSRGVMVFDALRKRKRRVCNHYKNDPKSFRSLPRQPVTR